LLVSGLAGQAGVLAQGGVEERDRLGQRDRQVEEQRALLGLPDGLGAEFALAFGGGAWLGGQQRGVQVGGFAAVAWRAAKLGAVGRFTLAEQQVGWRSMVWPGSKPSALAPGPHQRPGGSPPLSLAWM
jgi:hypothetical protein